MKNKTLRMRWFVCPKCGERIMLPKRSDQKTPQGHRKKVWCWKCQKMQTMIQVSK